MSDAKVVKPAYTRSERERRRVAYQEFLEKKKKKNKKRLQYFGGFLVLLVLFLWWGFMSPNATIEYPICRTFIELRQVYPGSVNIMEVDYFDGAVRVHYTARNAHGAIRSSVVECLFRSDPRAGLAIESITIDRQPYTDFEDIKKFNASIPAILANDLDLKFPPRIDKENLKDLKRDQIF